MSLWTTFDPFLEGAFDFPCFLIFSLCTPFHFLNHVVPGPTISTSTYFDSPDLHLYFLCTLTAMNGYVRGFLCQNNFSTSIKNCEKRDQIAFCVEFVNTCVFEFLDTDEGPYTFCVIFRYVCFSYCGILSKFIGWFLFMLCVCSHSQPRKQHKY